MSVIKVDNISKDYGSKRGVFNLSFEVNRGEIFGMLGPNGAGKTTTIRQLMGFIKSDKGSAKILDMDCFVNRENIQLKLGYLPGEIAFMDEMKGSDFIRFIAEMKSIKSKKRINDLTDLFELDANRKIKSMSKGTKQKIAIVCAFMNEPEVVILDEPTSGLDPLMQKKFIELILEEKKKGTTIFMSSHIFEEVEKTCDRTAILKDGKLIAIENMEELKSKKNKNFEVVFKTNEEALNFKNKISFKSEINNNIVKLSIINNEINNFIKELSNYDILDINSSSQTLEELFLHFYNK
ncbi:ABC transporter ATP-binding protein [Brachyspira pilosicoli]|uniref:ABC transporter ATP-binding protein n=1 Tax=Brachyspira pilosicoli TaxID=52584 RepID=A0AAJ6KDK6_BRAPL|nr:ABC transporter ATP-binding protein [Brachyspira pilosicoli]WIH90647.1 ABC transporter ATP-binding protein [Brachyspira pilosicoli]WIH92938.1 ABC transporter ATP-binding protein [Brachyspira pilosicoli]WIH95227.1 ABC transporter ATP-binding protein [Brachyspira pilosicoli]